MINDASDVSQLPALEKALARIVIVVLRLVRDLP